MDEMRDDGILIIFVISQHYFFIGLCIGTDYFKEVKTNFQAVRMSNIFMDIVKKVKRGHLLA